MKTKDGYQVYESMILEDENGNYLQVCVLFYHDFEPMAKVRHCKLNIEDYGINTVGDMFTMSEKEFLRFTYL